MANMHICSICRLKNINCRKHNDLGFLFLMKERVYFNMNHDIQRILCEYVEKQAEKTVVEFDNKAITYFEFDKQIRALADKLKEAGSLREV